MQQLFVVDFFYTFSDKCARVVFATNVNAVLNKIKKKNGKNNKLLAQRISEGK